MANNAAVRFVRQLIAAFSRFQISKETIELYTQKLSNWRLTQTEWDAALDKLIAGHQDESLPQLSEIYRYLKNEVSSSTVGKDLGFLYFTSEGYRYAVRVKYQNGKWVNAPCSLTDSHGKVVVLQKYPGDVPVLPVDAQDILIAPDNVDYIHLLETEGVRV